MRAFVEYIVCRQCGGDRCVRWFRARRFSIAMCEECVLAHPLKDGNGEFRLIAVSGHIEEAA